MDYAIENGINYFDTAYMYHVGKSEKFIGTALAKYPRESYYLADKLPIWMCKKPADMEKIFKNQLERTGADILIIIFFMHLTERTLKSAKNSAHMNFFRKNRKKEK